MDSAVAGAFAPETRAKESDENPTPDFASLAPKSLAPPTGKTLDHGLGAGADAVVEDEDAPGTNPEVTGSNPALDVDDVAPAAEARGVWAAKQLSARVHAVVYERTVAAESLAAARLDVERLANASGATDSELAKLRADVVAAETRAAEFGEAASKAKADAARLATEAKELKRVAEDASAKTNAIVAHDAAGKLAVADERASDLQARLDAAEERAMAAASEADAAVFKSDEAAAAAAAAEAAAAEADRQLARLAEESERLTESLIESETAAAEYQRLAMEAGRKNDELYSDLATLRAFVDVGVSVAEPVFQRVDALRRQNLRLRARLPMLAKRCVGARGVRLKALRERNAAVKDRKSFSDALKNGKDKYYELEVAFNETRLAMRDDLRAEKKKSVDAQDIAQKASAELDAIVKKQEQLKRELKLSVDRHKSSGKDSAAKLKDLEQRVAEAESKLRESQVDRAKNSRRAKDLEQQCAVLKKAAKAAEKSRAGAVAELSAKQVELSEADAKLKHAEAAAAAAAAAALASAHGAETLTMKLESQVDSSDRVRELREALTQALDAKAAAEERLASDVAALEADVKELIFLGQSTAKKPPGEPSTPHSSGGASDTRRRPRRTRRWRCRRFIRRGSTESSTEMDPPPTSHRPVTARGSPSWSKTRTRSPSNPRHPPPRPPPPKPPWISRRRWRRWRRNPTRYARSSRRFATPKQPPLEKQPPPEPKPRRARTASRFSRIHSRRRTRRRRSLRRTPPPRRSARLNTPRRWRTRSSARLNASPSNGPSPAPTTNFSRMELRKARTRPRPRSSPASARRPFPRASGTRRPGACSSTPRRRWPRPLAAARRRLSGSPSRP